MRARARACVCVGVCVCMYVWMYECTDARTNVHPMHPYSTYGMLLRTGNFFTLLKRAPTLLKELSFCPHCIYVFCIYLRTNCDLCRLQHKLIGFYNRDEVFTARYELGL